MNYLSCICNQEKNDRLQISFRGYLYKKIKATKPLQASHVILFLAVVKLKSERPSGCTNKSSKMFIRGKAWQLEIGAKYFFFFPAINCFIQCCVGMGIFSRHQSLQGLLLSRQKYEPYKDSIILIFKDKNSFDFTFSCQDCISLFRSRAIIFIELS